MNDNKDHYRINKYSSSYVYSLNHVENVFYTKKLSSPMTEELVHYRQLYLKKTNNKKQKKIKRTSNKTIGMQGILVCG